MQSTFAIVVHVTGLVESHCAKGEENTEEIQLLPVEDKENTHEMAMQLGLPPPEPLNLNGGNISANWNRNTQITKLRPE